MSKRKQSDILSFFMNKKTVNSEDLELQSGSDCKEKEGSLLKMSKEADTDTQPPGVQPSKSFEQILTPPVVVDKYDIGNFVEKSNIHNDEKYLALTRTWAPNSEYIFPSSIESGQQRKFNLKWLSDHPWISYSKKDEGAYCRICVLFGPQEAGLKKKTTLGKLVKSPLKKYKHALEAFRDHSNTEYHKMSLLKSSEFTNNFLNPTKKIDIALDSSAKKRVTENRKRLIPIVKTIILCGSQNIALRGHRDDGALDLEEKREHEGKFRALLKFRIDAGDVELENHLKNVPKNASFISKTTQNDIINCCGDVIVGKIAQEVQKSQIYSIIADETRDLGTVEQITLCLRYVDSSEAKIKEMFVGFIEAKEGVTGEKLTDLILGKLEELGLEISNIRGQAYDGGSNMAGHFQGVQARITKLNPLAVYTHCASHKLNLALTHASSERSIRNASGIIRETINFIKESPQRVNILEQFISEQHPQEKKHRLSSLCETRFVERHDAITFFLRIYDSVLSCITQIDNEKPTTKSAILLTSLQRFDFVITLHILGMVLDLTAQLSKNLQSPTLEIQESYSMANAVVRLLKRYRCEDDFYNRMFDAAKKVAIDNDIEVKSPRIVKSQIHRSNAEASTPHEYYRKNVFAPFLDTLISEMTARFSQNNAEVTKLFKLIPSAIRLANDDAIDEIISAAEKYCEEARVFQLRNEISLWREQWIQKKNSPSTAIKAYSDPSTRLYPNIRKLLHLLCVLPVTSCTGERSFSSLKLIKSYLRTTMGQERLNGCALMNIHKDVIDISASEVIDKFAQKHPRRLQLLYDE